MVVSSRPNGASPTGSGAWVHIPTDEATEDERLAEICLDGERWRTDGPQLSELLAIIDEAHERLRKGTLSKSC